MNSVVIQKSTLDFLKKLSSNNNREWFNDHKGQYLQARENMELFMDALLLKMSEHDSLETISGKKSLFRIYNDVRFFKNKLPYNPWLSAYLKRTKPLLRGGYYLRIQPGQCRLSCGFIYPSPEDLLRVREDISLNYSHWKKMLKSKAIINNFGGITGDQVKTTPRGFAADDPAIDLLRYKQYWFKHPFTDKEVIDPAFLLNVNKTFKSIRPLFDYMSEVLTTNANGESRY